LKGLRIKAYKISGLQFAAKSFCQRQSLVDRSSVTYIENVGVYGRAFWAIGLPWYGSHWQGAHAGDGRSRPTARESGHHASIGQRKAWPTSGYWGQTLRLCNGIFPCICCAYRGLASSMYLLSPTAKNGM